MIAKIRMIDTINEGAPHTSFLQYGDKITMKMFASDGQSIFGSLEQTVEKC